MARIPAGELERLKRETDLVEVVRRSGVELRRHGRDWVGLCPFHDDREPSLVITPAKGLWHCLGACQTGGTVIDWVMKREGVSFRHAAERLLEGRGEELELTPVLDPDADDGTLLGQVAAFYHETLTRSAEAVDYLKARGLDAPELIQRFQLGYANRTLGYRLPPMRLKAGAKLRSRL